MNHLMYRRELLRRSALAAASIAILSCAPAATGPTTSASLKPAKGGISVQVKLDPEWLRERGRRWPVTIDPSIFHIENTGDTRLRQQGANLDCWLKDGSSASTNLCGGGNINVGTNGGNNRRALLRFDVQSSIPRGIHVLDSELGLHLFDQVGTGTISVDAHRVTRSWTGGATWNTYDGTHAWTTGGGDYDASLAANNPSVGTR